MTWISLGAALANVLTQTAEAYRESLDTRRQVEKGEADAAAPDRDRQGEVEEVHPPRTQGGAREMSMSIAEIQKWVDFNRELGRTHASMPLDDLDWLCAMAAMVLKYQGQPQPFRARRTPGDQTDVRND